MIAASQPGEVCDQEQRQDEEAEEVSGRASRGRPVLVAGAHKHTMVEQARHRWQLFLSVPAGAVLRHLRVRVCSALGTAASAVGAGARALDPCGQGACPWRGCLVAAKTPGVRKKGVRALPSGRIMPRAGSLRGLTRASSVRVLERSPRQFAYHSYVPLPCLTLPALCAMQGLPAVSTDMHLAAS